MAFFKFPYTNYENINLDWLLRKVKQLEPAISIIETIDSDFSEMQEDIATANTNASAAVETANEAMELAEQAVATTIPDGSVTLAKLAQDVIAVINRKITWDDCSADFQAYLNGLNNRIYTLEQNQGQVANGSVTWAKLAQAVKTKINNLETATGTTLPNEIEQVSASIGSQIDTALTWSQIGYTSTRGGSITLPASGYHELLVRCYTTATSPYIGQSFVLNAGMTAPIMLPFDVGTETVYCVVNQSNTGSDARKAILDPNQTSTVTVYLRVYSR